MKKYRWKSADTGRFVTVEFAEANPKTCYKHVVKEKKV